MMISTQRIVMAGILMLVAASTAALAVWQTAEMNAAASSMAEVGWAVHFDFTGVQRGMRISVALIFSAVAVGSRRGAMWVLASLTVLFSTAVFIKLFIASISYPPPEQPEVYILVGLALMLAFILQFRRVQATLLASMGLLYVLMEYLIRWLPALFFTPGEAMGGDQDKPLTLLEHLFNETTRWEFGLLLAVIVLLIWQIAIFLRERLNARGMANAL